MDEIMEKYSTSPAFLSSTTAADNIECTGAENSFCGARTMTITDGRFFKIVPEKCIFNTTVATCVKCEPRSIEIKGTINSSSNFLCHLKRKHGSQAVQEYTEYLHSKKRCKRPANDAAQPKVRSKAATSEEIFERKILKFLIDSLLPLRTIASPSFLALFQNTNIPESDLKVINSQSLSLKVEQIFRKTMDRFRIQIKAASYVFWTANIWSGMDRSFLTITAHWIEEDMKRQSAALRFKRLGKNVSSESIASCIHRIQSDFGLKKTKVFAIDGEYCCNYLKAFNAYGVEKNSLGGPKEDSDDDDGLDRFKLNNEVLLPLTPICTKCPAKALTTCASVDMAKAISDCRYLSKLHERVMKKCNLLWNHPDAEDILEEITGLNLTRPCFTNWSSIYDSLREILTIKDRSADIFQALEDKDYLQESEFLYIEEHLACTKPFADALAILKENEYSVFGSLLPTLLALRRQLNKLLEKEWAFCRPVALENLRTVNERFQNFYNFSTPESLSASIAAFSHPEFKNRWLSCVEGKYQEKILNAFKQAVVADSPPTPRLSDTNKVDVQPGRQFFDFGTDIEVIEPISSTAVAEMQVLNFFNYTSRSLSSLDYFPEIKRVFHKYNTPLSSFACIDQMFSYETLDEVLSSEKLFDKNIEMRVLLKANMNMSHLAEYGI